MKRLIVATCVLLVLRMLTYGTFSAPAVYAKKPTPSTSPTASAARQEKAKRTLLKNVTKRDSKLNTIANHLKKKQSSFLPEDTSYMSFTITNMQEKMDEWRAALDSTTDLAELKTLQADWIRKTRLYEVFVPKYQLLMQLSVIHNGLPKVDARIAALEETYSGKQNSDKDDTYEVVGQKLQQAKDTLEQIRTNIIMAKVNILSLTSTLSNVKHDEFLKKKKESSTSLKTLKTSIKQELKLVKEIQKLLGKIKNAPKPTDSP